MSATRPTPGPDLDYAIAQYHREKEARRDAQREVERLRVQVDTLRDAIQETLAWPDTDATRAKLRAALNL